MYIFLFFQVRFLGFLRRLFFILLFLFFKSSPCNFWYSFVCFGGVGVGGWEGGSLFFFLFFCQLPLAALLPFILFVLLLSFILLPFLLLVFHSSPFCSSSLKPKKELTLLLPHVWHTKCCVWFQRLVLPYFDRQRWPSLHQTRHPLHGIQTLSPHCAWRSVSCRLP